MYRFLGLLIFGLALGLGWAARAEDRPLPTEVPSSNSQSPKKKQPKAPKQVEAEGTRALERNEIQEDTLIKSPYKINGEQLEVDPD